VYGKHKRRENKRKLGKGVRFSQYPLCRRPLHPRLSRFGFGLNSSFVEIGLDTLKDVRGLSVVSLLRLGQSSQTLDRLGLQHNPSTRDDQPNIPWGSEKAPNYVLQNSPHQPDGFFGSIDERLLGCLGFQAKLLSPRTGHVLLTCTSRIQCKAGQLATPKKSDDMLLREKGGGSPVLTEQS
jgi:hypothetical protein